MLRVSFLYTDLIIDISKPLNPTVIHRDVKNGRPILEIVRPFLYLCPLLAKRSLNTGCGF